MHVAAGEAFSREQQLRIADAVQAAEQQTGMRFAVYVGAVGDDVQAFADRQLAGLATGPQDEVALVLVGPAERVVRVATSPEARRRLPDQACALAVLSMTTSFGLGDLVGGIAVGLRMLADATVPSRDAHPPLDAEPAGEQFTAGGGHE